MKKSNAASEQAQIKHIKSAMSTALIGARKAAAKGDAEAHKSFMKQYDEANNALQALIDSHGKRD